MKKNNIIILITNFVLGLIKLFILGAFALAAFLDDYVIEYTMTEKYLFFSIGIVIAIALDLIVNYFVTKSIDKNSKSVKYVKLVIISLVITILEVIYVLKG